MSPLNLHPTLSTQSRKGAKSQSQIARVETPDFDKGMFDRGIKAIPCFPFHCQPFLCRTFFASLRLCAFALTLLIASHSAFSQLPTNNLAAGNLAVMANTNGVLAAPTNFFAANSNLLNASVAPAAGAAMLSGANVFTGVNAWTNAGTHTGLVISNSFLRYWSNGVILAELNESGSVKTINGTTNNVALGGYGNTTNGINFTNAASGTNVVAFIIGGTNVASVTGAGFAGPGPQITALNAGNIASGTLGYGNGGTAASSQGAARANLGGIQYNGGDNSSLDPSLGPIIAVPGVSGDYVGQIFKSKYQLLQWDGSSWGQPIQMPGGIDAYSTTRNHSFWVSNGVDATVEHRNFDVAHYSAERFLDNNGQEVGAVGWSNTNTVYTLANKFADGGNDGKGGFDFVESYGLNHGFYFVANGLLVHGMHSVSGDWVGFDGNTNVYYRFNRSTLELTNNGNIKAGNHLYAGNSLGSFQMTKTSGSTELLNDGAFDTTATVKWAKIIPNGYTTAGGVMYDVGNNNSGLYFPIADGNLHFANAGIDAGYVDQAQNWITYKTLYANHLAGYGAAPTIVTNSGAGTTTGSVYFTNNMAISDLSVRIVLNTGSSPATSSTIFTATYGTAWTSNKPPNVTITPGNGNAAAVSSTSAVFVDTQTTNAWTLKSGSAALSASTQYIWNARASQ